MVKWKLMPTVSLKLYLTHSMSFVVLLGTFHVKVHKGVNVYMFLVKLDFYSLQLFFNEREFQVSLPLNLTLSFIN